MENFPKVLLISVDPFNRSNGIGITLSNIFEGWEKDKIAQIYISDINPIQDVCNNYFHLKPKAAYWDYYFRFLLAKFNKRYLTEGVPAAVPLTSTNKTIKNIIHINLRAILDFSPLLLPNNLIKWIRQFDPDIIYSNLASARMIKLTNIIAENLNKPIVPHFMDDWPLILFTQNELGGLARKYFEKYFKKMLRMSNGGLCISNLMSVEYQKRYELPFTTIGNCVDDSAFICPNSSDSLPVFKIIYVGGLHLNRWESILDIAKAIEQINKSGQSIQLIIYSPEEDVTSYQYHFQSFKNTILKGSIKGKQVLSVLKNASMVLYVESFKDNFIKFIRYSLSTKIPQYMASGKPILAYGPTYLASIQHIIKSNSGMVISNNDKQDLSQTIEKIILNKKLLTELGNNGFTYAKKHHSKYSTHSLLKKTLIEYSR